MRCIISFVIVLACAACHSATKRSGLTAMEFVSDSEPTSVAPSDKKAEESDIRVDYVGAHAQRTLAKPDYPEDVMKAGGRSYVLYVTFVVAEDGSITDIQKSMFHISLQSEFSDVFFAAARDAIMKWQMEPTRKVYWKRAHGEEDRYLRTEAISETFEVKFTFETSGVVR
jgi:hypothetical protein